ncbi:TIGR03899 family protein [Photobacterium sanctipauli]|uniref:TIGR03899 family protein n=1 Tax=Photobacterium sanctipauli TaxID=1342794 RepID=A0A2T3NIX3_9GAMM|nr:TIGR03899 family protein [Photobacterium sanctipauli]PSW15170.1 TIGR03899 family protein [Photobacterium sanctipauli]
MSDHKVTPLSSTSAKPAIESSRKPDEESGSQFEDLAIGNGLSYLINKQGPETLHQRFKARQEIAEKQQQDNLEKIFKLTHESCKGKKTSELDPDWLYQFISISQQIQNTSMQRLWSRLLKQELITPQSISIKTLNILKKMTHKEAQIFHRACMLATQIGNDHSKKLITSLKRSPSLLSLLFSTKVEKLKLGYFQLPYADILTLMELGLLIRTELESGSLKPNIALSLRYQQYQYQLTPPKSGFSLTYYRFTPTGQEIADLLGDKAHEPFRESLLELLQQHFLIEER